MIHNYDHQKHLSKCDKMFKERKGGGDEKSQTPDGLFGRKWFPNCHPKI